jgi:hypothetical protein
MTNPCPPECLAAVQEAQTHNNEAQASNNAQTAQLLGRLSAPSVAAIPVQTGVYNITAGSEAGQATAVIEGATIEVTGYIFGSGNTFSASLTAFQDEDGTLVTGLNLGGVV